MVFCGYFSDGVTNIIKTNAKIKSQEYIEEVIKTEVLKEDYNFFYQSVTEEGIVIDSWNNIKKYINVRDCFFLFDEELSWNVIYGSI